MGRYYTDSILKKLFSLSGNICAFNSCNSKIIDEFGSIIGEICHIEGEKPSSPRYNSDVTDDERKSFENLILLCPNHHKTIDKNEKIYTVSYLRDIKYLHEKKYKNDAYNIPSKVLEIIKVSLNTDEYSLERVYNYLNLSKALKNKETIRLWYEKFHYVLSWLKISIPIENYEKLMLNDIFETILKLKTNKKEFEDLLLIFLEKIEYNEREIFIERIRDYIERIIYNDFDNENHRRFYKYLNKSDEETLDFLIDNSGSFKEDNFNQFINDNFNLKEIIQNKKQFLNLENKLWKKLDMAEGKKTKNQQQINNLKDLINRFILNNI